MTAAQLHHLPGGGLHVLILHLLVTTVIVVATRHVGSLEQRWIDREAGGSMRLQLQQTGRLLVIVRLHLTLALLLHAQVCGQLLFSIADVGCGLGARHPTVPTPSIWFHVGAQVVGRSGRRRSQATGRW